MIYCPHTRAYCGLDAVGAVGMRGDLSSPSPRFGDGHLDIGVGVLLRTGRYAFRQHGSGRKDLDEIGAVFEVRSYRLDNFLGAVGQVPPKGTSKIDRELPSVASAARRRHVVAGDEEPRSRNSPASIALRSSTST